MIRPTVMKTKAGIMVDSTIVEVPISAVQLWAENPRKNDTAVPKLAEIFKARGQVTPIVVWRKNNVCYKGNTTIKTLMYLGETTIKVLYADFPSEAAAIAYGIADNKSGEFSEWDDSMLGALLNAHETIDATTATGFTQKELNTFKLAMDMPDKLTAPGLAGELPMLGDFLVVQFDNTESLDAFKAFLGMGKQERAIDINNLVKFIPSYQE